MLVIDQADTYSRYLSQAMYRSDPVIERKFFDIVGNKKTIRASKGNYILRIT